MDRFVVDAIANVLSAATSADEAAAAALRRAWRIEQTGTDRDAIAKQIKVQENRIAIARANIDRATDLMLEQRIPQDACDRAIQRHQADADNAQDQLLKLRRELAVRPPKLPELDVLLPQLGGWAEVLKDSPVQQQRVVIGHLIEKIVAPPPGIPSPHSRGKPKARRNYGLTQITWTPLGQRLELALTRLDSYERLAPGLDG